MAKALDGFEDFNRRVRLPLGFRIRQPARELVFLTPSGRAEFSTAALPDVVPAAGTLALGTMRSHDQWNTTIYSDNDRYRGIKNLRTLVFMNRADMRERGGRQPAPPERLSGHPVRHSARLRGRVHARDEGAVRARRLQHAERPADHEARESDPRACHLSVAHSRPSGAQRTSPGTVSEDCSFTGR